MHYCRFHNTANNFDDCVVALRDNEYEYLDEDERQAADTLYELAKEYIDEYELSTGKK